MSAQVLIEGVSPNSIIAPGQRMRVQSTPLVKTLVRGGFARVVHDPDPDPVEEPAQVAETMPKRRRKTASVRTIEPAAADDPEVAL